MPTMPTIQNAPKNTTNTPTIIAHPSQPNHRENILGGNC